MTNNNTMNPSIYTVPNSTYSCKKIAKCVYFHKSNTPAIEAQNDTFKEAYKKAVGFMIKNNHPFEVIKIDGLANHFSLINAVGWDKLYEPVVGDSRIFDYNGDYIKTITGGKTVYHQKHLFVDNDYTGFSRFESEFRTTIIEFLPEVKETKGIKSKIGSLSFWNDFRFRNNLPAYMLGYHETLGAELADFISVWEDGVEIISKCMLNRNTGEILSIEMVTVDEDLGEFVEQYVRFKDDSVADVEYNEYLNQYYIKN